MIRHRHTLHVNPVLDLLTLPVWLLWALLDLTAEHATRWWSVHTRSERTAALVQLAINLALGLALIVALTACRPRDTQPGPIQTVVQNSAVKVVQP